MKTLDTQVGIYNTEYKLVCHRDGSHSVKTPYIKWTNNTGALAFKNVKIKRFASSIVDAFNGKSAMTVSAIVFENEL